MTLVLDNFGIFRPVPLERRHATVARWTLLILALGAFNAWAVGPYLTTELRRLEPWKVLAACSGDLVAAAWFVRFALLSLVRRGPLEDQPVGPRSRLGLILFVVSMFGGIALDFGFTVYLWRAEFARYDAATPAVASVLGMKTAHAPKGRNWMLDCTWRDATGRAFRGLLRLHAGGAPDEPVSPATGAVSLEGIPVEVPAETASLLARDVTPASLPIRFDPQWPQRSWIEGVPEDSNGLFFVSLFVLLAQGVVTAVAALTAWGRAFGASGDGAFPWWLELSKVFPTGVEMVVLAIVGAAMRLAGQS